MKKLLKLAYTGGLLSLMFILSSHELFLKTDTYFLQKGEPAEIFLFNGTFDNSENAITTDRVKFLLRSQRPDTGT